MAKEKTDRGRPVPMEIGDTLAALGKGGGCFKCGGAHFQRECPYKGKGRARETEAKECLARASPKEKFGAARGKAKEDETVHQA